MGAPLCAVLVRLYCRQQSLVAIALYSDVGPVDSRILCWRRARVRGRRKRVRLAF
jgi:hypothetical protein